MNSSDERISANSSDEGISAEEEELWAPQWKSIYESPQFESGMIGPFLQRWSIEDIDHIDDSEFLAVQFNGKVYKDENCHQRILQFLKQVRESRGYDVVDPPRCIQPPLWPRPLDEIKLSKRDYEFFIAKVNFVIAQVNSEAEKHGKRYELDNIEKVVEALAHRSTLLTLRVKSFGLSRRMKKVESVKTIQAYVYAECHNKFFLDEWRFKPQQPLNTSSSSSS